MNHTFYPVKIAIIVFIFCFFIGPFAHSQEDGGTIQDAKVLFDEAIKLKQKGQAEKAIKTFEKAIRTNRGILAEDDSGLIADLRDYYGKKLEKNSKDVEVLEAMGFISAVCDSDLKKSIEFYSQVESLTKDDGEKEKISHMLDRLRAQYEATRQITDEHTSKAREERLKSWSEMEKQDALAAQGEAKGQMHEKLSDLYRKKDDLTARIPQLEDDLKELEKESERDHRMYYTTNDRRYRRKEFRSDDELNAKKAELENAKKEVEKSEKEIEELTKKVDEMEKKAGVGVRIPKPGEESGEASTDSTSGITTNSSTETTSATNTGPSTDSSSGTITGSSIDTNSGTTTSSSNDSTPSPVIPAPGVTSTDSSNSSGISSTGTENSNPTSTAVKETSTGSGSETGTSTPSGN
ncbi:MAG: hypothetical protein HQM08_11140 [Candidatus Riflebacteria bacterium]|nr:hypothetical protein [Candidatus Riflebacteria bacterium]